jgi:hypothetical protein
MQGSGFTTESRFRKGWIAIAVAAVLVFHGCSQQGGSAPRVVSTYPKDGNIEVPSGQIVVSILFSDVMKQRQWSISPVGDAKFPKFIGKPRFISLEQITVKCDLKPDTVYGIGVNSGKNKYFRNIHGVEAEPYIFTFKTAKLNVETVKIEEEIPLGKELEKKEYILTREYTESKERAFSLLVPDGWVTEGGISRSPGADESSPIVDQCGYRLKFAVKDPESGAEVRWFDRDVYVDLTRTVPELLNAHPMRSIYNNLIVYPELRPHEFVLDFLLPEKRAGISNMALEKEVMLPETAQKFKEVFSGTSEEKYSAAMITLLYGEGETLYREFFILVLCSRPLADLRMWENVYTLGIRAPVDGVRELYPELVTAAASFFIEPTWRLAESQRTAECLGRLEEKIGEITRINNQYEKEKGEMMSLLFDEADLIERDPLICTDADKKREFVIPYPFAFQWIGADGTVLLSKEGDFSPVKRGLKVPKNLRKIECRPYK